MFAAVRWSWKSLLRGWRGVKGSAPICAKNCRRLTFLTFVRKVFKILTGMGLTLVRILTRVDWCGSIPSCQLAVG